MASESSVKKARHNLGEALRNQWLEASYIYCEPLTFDALFRGDKFVAMPTPGDNESHGGLLGIFDIFVKTDLICHPSTPTNATRICDGSVSFFTNNLLVIKVR